MKQRRLFFSLIAGLLALWLWHGGWATAANAAPASQRTPVLVELFTSEGCSSCPPADTVLSELERDQPVPNAQIIALGQHVDYWNNGSWTDRFSSQAYTLRQNNYATHFHNTTVYTPQMIVDGQAEFVGSDKNRALQEITRAAQTPKAAVQISRVNGDSTSGEAVKTIPLRIKIDHLPAMPRGEQALVMLAVTEDDLHSVVRGGENRGRTLDHSAVVRRLGVLGGMKAGETFTGSPVVALSRDWNRAHLQAVVFVQAKNSRRILGAGIVPLGKGISSPG
jgi:hypothetical protein